MRKLSILTFILGFTFSTIIAQVFDKAQTNLKGVMQPVMTWVYNGDLMDAYLAGDYYSDENHYVVSNFNTYFNKNRFKKISSRLPALYRGGAAAGDYDYDGDDDVVVTGVNELGQLTMRLYRNDGNAGFTVINEIFVPLSDGSVEFGDYDNDDDLDILATGMQFDKILMTCIYRNDNGIFSLTDPGIPGVYNGNASWGDFDNDKDLDILITGNTGNKPFTAVYQNNNGLYNKVVQQFIPLKNSAGIWGDLDNDQYLDFIISGEDADGYPVCMVYKNQSATFFKEEAVSVRPLKNCSIDLGDFDADSDLDIIMTGESLERPYSYVYENKGNFNFSDIMAGLPGVSEGNALWGDFDGDGDQDILIAGLTICYDFIGDIYINNIDPPEKETINDIFINAPNPDTRVGPFYYYVFSSCYCDPKGGDDYAYHLYISNVHLMNQRYELNYEFNELLLKRVPNWGDADRGYRTSNGFATKSEAEESRRQVIESYKSTNFFIHQFNW